MWRKGDTNLKNRIYATVTAILHSGLEIRVGSKKPSVDYTYNIIFILNRFQIQMEHRALETVKKFRLINLLFPDPLPPLRNAKLSGQIKEYVHYRL